MRNSSPGESSTLPRQSDVSEAEVMRQPGQYPWPGRSDRSNISGERQPGSADYSPRWRQGERSVYEGFDGHPYKEYSGTTQKAYFGTRSSSFRSPMREGDHQHRDRRNSGSWPSKQTYLDEEAKLIIREWKFQLNESRSRVYDYQQRVVKNQQEIEDLKNSINLLRSELSFSKDEFEQLKSGNVNSNVKFQELLVLERRNVDRLREEEFRCKRLEDELILVLSEKDQAVARAEELRSVKSSLEMNINELETNAKVLSRLELEAKAMAEKIVSEKLEKHKEKKAIKQREVERHYNRAVLALHDAKEDKKLLREASGRLKQEIRAVKSLLAKQRAKKTLHLNLKRGPQRYNGPLKGKGNLFWLKFRNPELKEEFEGQESPAVTPTSTPESSPEL